MKRGLYSAIAIGAVSMVFGQNVEAANTTTYTVQSGDSLGLIAMKYNTTTTKIQKLNNLTSDLIYVNQKLKVPSTKSATTKTTTTAKKATTNKTETKTYTVQSGDSLGLIAVKHNMSITELKKLNNLSSDFIYVSQKLKVSKADVTKKTTASKKPAAQKTTATKKTTTTTKKETSNTTTYTVASGDSLGAIAVKTNMSISSLKALNNLNSDLIFVGQKLKVSGSTKTTTASKTTTTTKKETTKTSNSVSYSTQRILDIAKKYTGVPYLFGGTTPSGFDCSGYIYHVYKEAGLNLGGRKTAEGYAALAKSVSSPKVGDLVFFQGTYSGMQGRISHVGIYLGDGKFISALSKGIGISDLKYWKDSFVRYGRL